MIGFWFKGSLGIGNRKEKEVSLDGKRDDLNGELARETFMNLGWEGRLRNLTFEERKALEIFLEKGVTRGFKLGCGTLFNDPVLHLRTKRAVEKYGDIVLDILNDIHCGFPEDGLNEELTEDGKNFLTKDLFKESKGGV